MQFPDARILIFAKAPEPGYAKTRLIPALGADGAADLQSRLLERMIREVSTANLCPVELWCAPNTNHPVFQDLAGGYALSLYSQIDGDLGERMCFAADEALCRSGMVLLIGVDCPLMDADYLRHALDWLGGDDDAVLGPAEDGGYVLLGLKCSEPSLFQDIPWGSDEVLACTRTKLKALGMRWRELLVLWDLDRPGDLERLPPLS